MTFITAQIIVTEVNKELFLMHQLELEANAVLQRRRVKSQELLSVK